MSKKYKIVAVANINGRTYKTADKAATAFALAVSSNRFERHTKKIGHAAYHDTAWFTRHVRGTPIVTVKGIAVYEGLGDIERRAYRRSLKIFKKFLP